MAGLLAATNLTRLNKTLKSLQGQAKNENQSQFKHFNFPQDRFLNAQFKYFYLSYTKINKCTHRRYRIYAMQTMVLTLC